jgi:hypothetical protein
LNSEWQSLQPQTQQELKNTMNAMQPPQSIEEIKAGTGNYRERRCPSEHTELPDRIPA